MYLITGGAGFIGSNIAAALDECGDDIVIVDWLGTSDFKWRNIAKRRIRAIVRPEECIEFVEENAADVSGIFHMGAISATTETDVDLIVRSNINLSSALWAAAAKYGIPFVYASSAATYGDGSLGFQDRFDEEYLSQLRPLNAYGWSKHVFDRMVLASIKRGEPAPPVWAGLKFFNVYGPNEYHKGSQRSVAVQLHTQIRADARARLFRSDNPDYADGGQLRDFVWVGDCVEVALWLMKAGEPQSGLYNVGSGEARSFRDKAEIIFRNVGAPVEIEYVDLPKNLQGKYQYYTCAPLEKLRLAGYNQPMTSLEDGLQRYVLDHLEQSDIFV
ncbi:ADP-glyceromanno-heptose 6-epimerase [Sinorhizobium sp. A49]|uniref:ADP-glyceromanno-heptose 6-epimerase n=1 Tax=Sinorhizobium sp. A49 TaxID=1945861 RepID=UPI000984CF67|nr:ADP-glyceromanno-heptose 6-epimerase [Sinorhizobium sp. A49]OOG63080.1 ADP-glyceromanno-heptose 6-epimerase [Sinorhizobium sp. A49]